MSLILRVPWDIIERLAACYVLHAMYVYVENTNSYIRMVKSQSIVANFYTDNIMIVLTAV